ncbi:MAG: VTT domain-containing protein [Gemmatimonadetes bacterium]|nr:VTT domain-containing protein [Gemmatimonadota bacterium]
MRKYWKVAGALFGLLLALFFLFEALEIPIFTDPSGIIGRGGTTAALVGVGLLVVDVFLPVPSSFVMVAHGALFGVWVGTLLSMFGQMGAALLGSAVGRAGGPLMERMVSPEEKVRADRFVRRWGALAIVVSRPIPLFAETVAILAGVSRVSWLRVALAAAAGSLPPALLYALTGAVADSFQSAALMFGFVILMTGLTWMIGTRLGKEADGDS